MNIKDVCQLEPTLANNPKVRCNRSTSVDIIDEYFNNYAQAQVNVGEVYEVYDTRYKVIDKLGYSECWSVKDGGDSVSYTKDIYEFEKDSEYAEIQIFCKMKPLKSPTGVNTCKERDDAWFRVEYFDIIED